ncbi:MAG: ribosomal L7Ae/L30e/S12e/Gadd45 family protein [Lachnospiraceae bacterium]|nr:ribosomal L7Ae/L30e/S12e/Gadd45 family protein [Cuneatibacter sp.]MDD6456625.1 ribosomal L7Ae/L30e/S12e/Gadd45 family protein [Lachnospiraceae bacterium]
MANQDKVLSMLGLAARARGVADGGFSVEKAIKSGKAALVILAGDASDNSRKEFVNMCSYYRTPIYQYSNKEELGHSIGKELRSVVAVLDVGIAKAIKERLKEMEQTEAVEWQK